MSLRKQASTITAAVHGLPRFVAQPTMTAMKTGRRADWATLLLWMLLLAPVVSLRFATRAAESAPSRSRLGINLAGPADWSTEHPFVDVFRLSRKWISQRQGEAWGKGPELKLDARGWITALEANCWTETPILTAGHAPRGEYVCLYDGEGELDFKNNARVVARAPGRIVVDIDGAKGGVFVQLRRTNPTNHVRNIRVLMPGFEQSYREQVFHPTFLQRWSGMNTIRFMDWQETNGSKQRDWHDRPTLEDSNWTEKGIPIEVMVDLCNRLKINPWFCMPHLATDDYVRQFARLAKTRLDPALVVYVEYSNEVWNSQFAQTKHSETEGQRLGFSDKAWEAGWRYCAFRSVQIHRLWENEFGGRDRLVRVIATQAAVPHVSEQKLQFQDSWKHFDALAVAPYFSMNISPKGNRETPGADEIANWPLERLLDFVAANSLPQAAEWTRKQKAIADRYKLKLIAYEAGQHLVGVGGGENNDALTALLQSANRHPRMKEFYTRYLDDWKQAGGELCCLFSSIGGYSKWGSWGLLEFADETGSPKFDAVMKWNRGNLTSK